MAEGPVHVTQDARTEVQLLPQGVTLEEISALLTDDLLRSHVKLERIRADQVREGALPGQRLLMMSIQALDIAQPYDLPWRGSADLYLEHYEEHDAPAVRILVKGFSGSTDETEMANTARVAWRLGDAIKHGFT